jgi:hypothetical protein
LKDIIFFSRFRPDSNADGGFRRTAQMVESFSNLNYAFVSVADFYSEFYKKDYSTSPQYQEYLNSFPFSEYLDKWIPKRRNNIHFLHHVSWVWKKRIIEGCIRPKLVIIDDPIYFSPLIEYLSTISIPIIAHCHNIESLSSSQIIKEYQLDLLNDELRILSLCSLVITISREETFLLRNFGIPTLYYSYFPVTGQCQKMKTVREKRKKAEKKDFLMIGTANNPPTMAGMRELMKNWKPNIKTGMKEKLLVGGFGSESLKELADGEDVVYKGVLTDDELDKILTNIKGCIVYQNDGSGALTKICEFLLADIPVLANSHAARSYYHLPGIFEFRSITDLQNLPEKLINSDMHIAEPEPPDSNSLLNSVEKLLRESELKDFLPDEDSQQNEITGDKKINFNSKAVFVEKKAIDTNQKSVINNLNSYFTRSMNWITSFFKGGRFS